MYSIKRPKQGHRKGKALKKRKLDKSVFKSLTLISQFGINMIVPVVMCMLLGIFLDNKFETGYWTVILFFVGALAGFNSVYKMAKKVCGDKSSKEND